MNSGSNGTCSRGHPESVAPEFVGRSRLKVKNQIELAKSVETEFDVIFSHLVLAK